MQTGATFGAHLLGNGGPNLSEHAKNINPMQLQLALSVSVSKILAPTLHFFHISCWHSFNAVSKTLSSMEEGPTVVATWGGGPFEILSDVAQETKDH